jgi:hypothetical protein
MAGQAAGGARKDGCFHVLDWVLGSAGPESRGSGDARCILFVHEVKVAQLHSMSSDKMHAIIGNWSVGVRERWIPVPPCGSQASRASSLRRGETSAH